MNEAALKLEHKFKQRFAPLFAGQGTVAAAADEEAPKGFVSTAESKRLRRILKKLLSKKGAIALSTDKTTAVNILKETRDRRLTIAEARLINDLHGNYRNWKRRKAARQAGRY